VKPEACTPERYRRYWPKRGFTMLLKIDPNVYVTLRDRLYS
jgi:hypothetical protein